MYIKNRKSQLYNYYLDHISLDLAIASRTYISLDLAMASRSYLT